MAELIGHLLDGASLDEGLDRSSETLRIYAGHEETLHKVAQARALAGNGTAIDPAIREIGEGWVGEEALGVAIFCSLRFPDDCWTNRRLGWMWWQSSASGRRSGA